MTIMKDQEPNSDKEIKDFFESWKAADKQHAVPDFDSMLPIEPPGERPGRMVWLGVAASIVVVMGFSLWYWLLKPTSEFDAFAKTEIMITIDQEEASAAFANEWEVPGIDNWESETDVLLTGL